MSTAWLDAIGASHAADPRCDVWDVRLARDGDRSVIEGATSAVAALAALQEEAARRRATVRVRLLPDPELGSRVRAVCHRSLACLRREPGHRSELVSQLIMGEEALVLRRRNEWLQVRCGDPYVAWIHAGSCRVLDCEDVAAFRARLETRAPAGDVSVVTRPRVVARSEPADDAPVAADLVEGARVSIAGRAADWADLSLPDGTRGWVPGDAVTPWNQLAVRYPQTGAAVLSHGGRFLGLPYLWGGTTEKGFDCSGFTQRIFGLHGCLLPRDADQQARVGAAVDRTAGWGAIRDGDLAFFSERSDGHVTHVGVLATGGRMLHASTTRNGVAWNALDPDDPDFNAYSERLSGWLTDVRRPLAGPES